jgi:hypothetical protein
MIDFRKLVLEAIAVNSKLSDFYNDSSSMSVLRSFLQSTFKINSWPSSGSLFPIANDVYQRQRAESLIPFIKIFPLLDFIWYFIQNNGSTRKSTEILIDNSGTKLFSPMSVERLSSTFATECKGANPGNNLDPLFGYHPISPTAIVLQKPLINKASSNNFMSNIAQISKGLSLGVKNMGT